MTTVYAGGFLCDYSIRVCFIVAGAVSLLSILSCWLLLEETLFYHHHSSSSLTSLTTTTMKQFDFSKANPFPALRVHLSNRRMQQLSIPFVLSTLAIGLGYVFIIFMDYRYHSSSTSVGIYIAFFGLVNAAVQGVFVPKIIPNIWNEQRATMYGLLMSAMQTLCFGLCPVDWGLYVLVLVFCLGTVYDPALKGLIVQESRVRVTGGDSGTSSTSRRSYHYPVAAAVAAAVPSSVCGGDDDEEEEEEESMNHEQHQGNLQGALSSIRTLATGVGALVFGWIFSFSVSDNTRPAAPWLAFAVGAVLYFLGWVYCYLLFSNNVWGAMGDDDKNEALLGALDDDSVQG